MLRVCLLLLIPAATLLQDSDPTLLLPLENRNEWIYETADGGAARMKVLRKKKYKGKVYWVVQFDRPDGRETKHLRVDGDGIKQHHYEFRTSDEILSVPAPTPVFELVFPTDAGRTWELRLRGQEGLIRKIHTVQEPRTLQVPAGKFTCIGVELKVLTDDKETERTTTWFAPRIGIVRIEQTVGRVRHLFSLKSHKVRLPKGSEEPPPDPDELKARALKALKGVLEMTGDPETVRVLTAVAEGGFGRPLEATESDPASRLEPAVVKRLKALSPIGEAYAKIAKEDLQMEVLAHLLRTLPEHIRALKTLNRVRAEAGLKPVDWDWEISVGAALHARYLAKTGYAGVVRSLHDENKTSPYYTEQGARAGPKSVIAAHALNRSVEDWMASFYHRIPLLKPHLKRIGTGMWAGGIDLATPSVMDTSSGAEGAMPDEPVAWPPADSEKVPTRFTNQGENPEPSPGLDETEFGYPVTLTFNAPPSTVRARLFDGKREVECVVSSTDRPSNPKAARPRTVCLMPKKELRSGRTYRVLIECKRAGRPFRKEWSFKTR